MKWTKHQILPKSEFDNVLSRFNDRVEPLLEKLLQELDRLQKEQATQQESK